MLDLARRCCLLKTENRGQALVNILLLAILFVGAVSLASQSWIGQMSLTQKAAAVAGARRLAESAAQVAIARILKNPDDQLDLVELEIPTYQGGSGQLTCNTQKAKDLNIALSVNNLKGASSRPGANGTVAPETANLVATGRLRGSVVKIEVVLNVPAFPYVVASSVPIHSIDGLQIFGLKSPESLKNGFGGIAPDDKVPGHIATNAANPSAGLASLRLLGTSSRIEGDAQSFGQIKVDPGVTVKGELRPGSEMVPMPAIDVTKFDPASNPGNNAIAASSLHQPKLGGFNRSKNLTVSGGLELDSGVLYVEGKLVVHGGLSGKGAILATGGVEIHGGGSLSGDNQAAIISKGPISIEGAPDRQSEFRGLVYTEGNLNCKYTNIVGAVVVNNPDPTGTATLEQVALAQQDQLARTELTVVSSSQSQAPPPSSGGGSTVAVGNSVSQPMDLNGLQLPSSWLSKLTPPRTSFLANPSSSPLYVSNQSDPNYGRFQAPATLPPDPIGLAAPAALKFDGPTPKYYNFSNAIELRSELLSLIQDVQAQDPSYSPADPNALVDSVVSAYQQNVVSDLSWGITSLNGTLDPSSDPSDPSGGGQQGDPSTTPVSSSSTWTLDLSQFLKLSDRIRVLSWRQL